MKKHISYMAAILATAGLAQAATIYQVQTVADHGPGGNLTPYTADLTFHEFNHYMTDEEGILTSVRVVLTVNTWGGSVANDNDGVNPASGAVAVGASAALSKKTGDVVLVNADVVNVWHASAYASDTFNLDPNVGDNIGSYDTGGADWDELVGPAKDGANTDDADDYIDADYVSRYNGTGTFVLTFSSTQYASLLTQGDVWGLTGPMQANGMVEVYYDYTPIPEPTSLAFIGLGGLVLGLRRRVKKA